MSLEAAKQHLRITSDDDDDSIMREIQAATAWAEDETHRILDSRTLKLYLCEFPYDDIVLRGAISSVSSIQYRDFSGNLLTVAGPNDSPASSAIYSVLIGQHSTVISQTPNYSWPGTGEYEDAVQITYVEGFTYSTVPLQIMQAILLKLGWFHSIRDALDADDTNTAIGRGVDIAASNLLKPWKVPIW